MFLQILKNIQEHTTTCLPSNPSPRRSFFISNRPLKITYLQERPEATGETHRIYEPRRHQDQFQTPKIHIQRAFTSRHSSSDAQSAPWNSSEAIYPSPTTSPSDSSVEPSCVVVACFLVPSIISLPPTPFRTRYVPFDDENSHRLYPPL